MSKYTREYLASSVKASDKHGLPWWSNGTEPNIYHDSFIPFTDVHEQLAGWEPTTAPLLDEDVVVALVNEGWAGADLIQKIANSRVDSHKLIKTDEGKDVIGIDHAIHLFGTWLTGTIKEVIGDEAQILSSGNLDRKMQAWVCVARPEPSHGPGGIDFSPMITFSSSYNGTMKTQINQNTVLPICDNTVSWARQQGTAFKHTSGSASRLGTYRSVTQALVDGETDFRKVLDELLTIEVTEKDAGRFLDRYMPVDENEDSDRKKSIRKRVKREITELYLTDPRVADKQGTGFGLLQAVNTWERYRSTIQNRTGDGEVDDKNLRAMRLYSERMKLVKKGVETSDETNLRLLRETLDTDHKNTFAMA